jgi:uncharacterized protein YndB with AHSA1/START domain
MNHSTVTRTFNAPAQRVFDAWTRPELFKQWWTPKSFGMSFLSCEIDARTGGSYRFTFSHPSAKEPMAFFGKYLEATPPSRLVWTNDEAGGEGAVTTVTFEQRGPENRPETLLTLHDPDPQKEALDEQFKQLDALLADQRRHP